jgi:hypothetical protein
MTLTINGAIGLQNLPPELGSLSPLDDRLNPWHSIMKDTSTQGILTGATSEVAMIHTNRMSKMKGNPESCDNVHISRRMLVD